MMTFALYDQWYWTTLVLATIPAIIGAFLIRGAIRDLRRIHSHKKGEE